MLSIRWLATSCEVLITEPMRFLPEFNEMCDTGGNQRYAGKLAESLSFGQ
jgi:hypothetical protein